MLVSKMPNKSKNHEDCRKTVCFLCMQKSDRELTQFMIERVHKIVKSDLDFDNDKTPRGVCASCRVLLQKRDKGDSSIVLPSLFNFDAIKTKPSTRMSFVCDCLICKIGKLKLNETHPLASVKVKENPAQKSPAAGSPAEKRCTKCLSIIARGRTHICTIGTRHKNLQELVQNDPVGAEQLASSVISLKEASPGGTVRLSQITGGKLFPVMPGIKQKNALFSKFCL
jgi:hypothetical protein